MELGMIGLGRLGANMSERLVRAGHRVVGYDRDREAVKRVVGKGAEGVDGLEQLVNKLAAPRAVWLMVPAGDPVDKTIQALLPHLRSGDAILDGGNSYYKDSMRRSAQLRERGLHFVDVGTSGGIWGLAEGYSLMVGGEKTRLSDSAPSLRPSRLRRTEAGDTSVRAVPGISRRWCITGLNMASCNPTPRASPY